MESLPKKQIQHENSLKSLNISHSIKSTIEQIQCIQFFWDDNCFAIGSKKGIIEIWTSNKRNENFKLIHRIKGHEGLISDFKFKGDVLYSCSADKTIRLWDSHNLFKSITVINWENSVAVNIMCISKKAIIAGSQHGQISTWNKQTFKQLQIIDNVMKKGMQAKQTIYGMIMVNKKQIAVSCDRFINIYNIKKGKIVHQIKDHKDNVMDLLSLQDKVSFLSSSSDMTMKIWDAKDFTCKMNIDCIFTSPLYVYQYRKNILCCGDFETENLYFYDLEKRNFVHKIPDFWYGHVQKNGNFAMINSDQFVRFLEPKAQQKIQQVLEPEVQKKLRTL